MAKQTELAKARTKIANLEEERLNLEEELAQLRDELAATRQKAEDDVVTVLEASADIFGAYGRILLVGTE